MRRPSIKRPAVVVGAILAITALLLVGAGAAFGLNSWSRVGEVDVAPTGADPPSTSTLIVGVDSRAAANADPRGGERFPDRRSVEGERADVLILLRQSDDGTQLTLIPRDLLVKDPAGRLSRLAVEWRRSPQQLLSALCGLESGIGVDHVVAVDYRALVTLVDAVGGMPITTAVPIRDRKAHLLPTRVGEQILTGEQTLAWVRSRTPEQLTPTGWEPLPQNADLRAERAVEAMSRVADRAWVRSPSLLRALPTSAQSVRVDSGTSMWGFVDLARDLHRAPSATTLPSTLVPGNVPYATLDEGAAAVITERAERCNT